jgi:hypothetical protein
VQLILEPTKPEESHEALVTAALTPETFRTIYEYFRGKKLPEPTFFQNTVVREFPGATRARGALRYDLQRKYGTREPGPRSY